LKTIKIYLLLVIICVATSKSGRAQIILPTLQASSYVSIKLEINSITEITNNTAKVLVTVSASTNGRSSIGVCWRTSANPSTLDNVSFYSGSNLSYSLNISSGLSNNTSYYIRPFIVIGGKTFYGDNVLFTTTKGNKTPTDGKLNFVTMNTPGGQYADDEAEFDSQIAPGYGDIIQSGVADISVIIDFSNRTQLSNAGISVSSNGERFSIVTSGFFIPSETGTYRFTCEGDDAVDLFINGVNVANHYGGHAIGALGSHTGTISLTAGTKYSFRARMQEFAGGEGLRVFWRKPSQSGSTNWFQDVNEVSSY
jgi:hypothetical protein